MKVNQIRAGAILSYLSMGLGIVISLVYTPVMVDCLGSSEYAVYNLVLPIISYLSLMSLGLGSAYVRYYSRYKVAGDKKNMAKLNGMFLVTYSVLGAALLALGFLLSLKGEWIFGSKLTAEEIQLGCRLLRIMSVNAALCLPISVFESHVAIQERYLFQKILAMGKQVLNPLLMIPLLLLGYRSVTLTVVALGFTVVSGLVNVYYCLVKLEMPFRFGRYDFRLMREMMGFTVYVFIGIVVNNFNWAIDRLLLGWIHGTDAVTIYVPAAQLNTYFLSIATIISGVLIPRVNRIVAEKRPMRELDALFTKTGRLQFIILSCVLWGFVAVGRPFVVLWMGAPEFSADYTITLILMFACVWSNCQTLGIEIQTAMNMHRFRSLVYAAVDAAQWFVTRLNTNGRRLTPELCKGLYEASLDSVQVTLYSDKAAIHNALVGVDGFGDTVAGIRNAVQAGLIVSINTPLCSVNRDYADTLRFAAGLGVRYATCSGLIPSGGATTEGSVATRLAESELEEILRSAVKTAKELDMELDFTSPGWLEEETLRGLGLHLIPSCGACLSNMALAPDGSVVPCQSWLGGVTLGHILHDDWLSVWDSEKCRAIRAESAKTEHICQLRQGNQGGC